MGISAIFWRVKMKLSALVRGGVELTKGEYFQLLFLPLLLLLLLLLKLRVLSQKCLRMLKRC